MIEGKITIESRLQPIHPPHKQRLQIRHSLHHLRQAAVLASDEMRGPAPGRQLAVGDQLVVNGPEYVLDDFVGTRLTVLIAGVVNRKAGRPALITATAGIG